MKNYYILENDGNLKSKIKSTEYFNRNAIKIGETPVMTEKDVFPQILENHMAPKGKWGKVVVLEGNLQYKWHDDENIYDIDSENSLIIEPERLHNVILKGEVKFKVEFYKIELSEDKNEFHENVLRPGENFI